MLTDSVLERILSHLPQLTIGVVGDLFLDRYLEIDATLTEPSLETGLDAYQVVRVRASAGAAGTVVNNLAALGIKQVQVVSMIGDDGEGYELRQALDALGKVNLDRVTIAGDRRTPTYTKPMFLESGRAPRELNRLDIKNRRVLSAVSESEILRGLDKIWPQADAIMVLDQVSEPNCGVITDRVRVRLAGLAHRSPEKFVLADSRERIGLFRSVASKPNQRECLGAVADECDNVQQAASSLARRTGRTVFCTQGEGGILLAEPSGKVDRVPAYPVSGPIDIVGAGDSTSAAIASAVAAGASFEQAAAFGCLVASVTIKQIGTTGTATPSQILERWKEIRTARE
jgi:rfaE bifunctional protein kinase chain/domain